MYSMILARDRAEPESRTKGSSGKLVAFCSEQSHYSYRKSAMVMGLGSDNMIKVPCDERGEMIPEALEREVIAAKARGKVPFYVGTTAGNAQHIGDAGRPIFGKRAEVNTAEAQTKDK